MEGKYTATITANTGADNFDDAVTKFGSYGIVSNQKK